VSELKVHCGCVRAVLAITRDNPSPFICQHGAASNNCRQFGIRHARPRYFTLNNVQETGDHSSRPINRQSRHGIVDIKQKKRRGIHYLQKHNPQVKVLAPIRNLNIELEEVYGELVA
jgi:hypothetical protein